MLTIGNVYHICNYIIDFQVSIITCGMVIVYDQENKR